MLELAHSRPHAELSRLVEPGSVWPSERRLRLFACGCCRQWWNELAPVCRRAVRTAERYADGRCGIDRLEAAWRECRAAERRGLSVARTTEHVHRVAAPVLTPADAQVVATDLRPWRGVSADNDAVDAACERVWADVFGGAGVAFEPPWLTTTVRTLARTMYDSGEFSAMAILADALQDAGCDEATALNHCRDTTQVHVRGCWVVDAVLGLR